jgi:hypothetical protein
MVLFKGFTEEGNDFERQDAPRSKVVPVGESTWNGKDLTLENALRFLHQFPNVNLFNLGSRSAKRMREFAITVDSSRKELENFWFHD